MRAISDPMPIDLDAGELADLVASDTRRRVITGLAELMMEHPTELYEPRIPRLVVDVLELGECADTMHTSPKEIHVTAEQIRETHLPVLDEYGVLEHDTSADRVRTTKSTLLFAAAIEEIEAAIDTDADVTITHELSKRAAEAWLATATRGVA